MLSVGLALDAGKAILAATPYRLVPAVKAELDEARKRMRQMKADEEREMAEARRVAEAAEAAEAAETFALAAEAEARAAQAEARAAEAEAAKAKAAADARQTAEAAELCVICMDGARSHAFVPCGHRNVCGACSETKISRLTECPTCRKPFTSIMQVWT